MSFLRITYKLPVMSTFEIICAVLIVVLSIYLFMEKVKNELGEEDLKNKQRLIEASKERLSLFDNHIAALISRNFDKIDKSNDSIDRFVANPIAFLESNAWYFQEAYPSFVAKLKEKGLDDNEIGCCCLYAMGLKGKEISKYIGRKSHFNDCSRIRAKLGISEHDTNLGLYLQSMVKE